MTRLVRLLRLLGALALPIPLAACPGLGSTAPAAVTTTIAAVGEGLTTADQLALVYVTLPLCPTGASMAANGTLCSQATISAQIKAAAATAYAAYKVAEATPALIANASAALAAYQALIPATAN